MTQDQPQSTPPKKPPVRALTWVVLGVAVVVLAAVLIPRPPDTRMGTPSELPSARMANQQQAQQMEEQMTKAAANQKPGLDAQHFLSLVREATNQYQHDNMASIYAGKEAIELLDASKDSESAGLYRAEIALIVARSAKASGDRADQVAYYALGEKSFNAVMDDPHASAAQKAQAKEDLAHLKEFAP